MRDNPSARRQLRSPGVPTLRGTGAAGGRSRPGRGALVQAWLHEGPGLPGRPTRAALALGHNHSGREHILLGIVRERDVGVRVLHDMGVDAKAVGNEVYRLLPPGVPRPLTARTSRQGRRNRLKEIERLLAEILARLEAIERQLPPEPE